MYVHPTADNLTPPPLSSLVVPFLVLIARGLHVAKDWKTQDDWLVMALSKLSGDEKRLIFSRLCNPLDPGFAVAFSSVSSELWTLTPALRRQLKTDNEAAAVFARRVGFFGLDRRVCRLLREARSVSCWNIGITADHLALLGTLGSFLPCLLRLVVYARFSAIAPDGVQQFAEKLRAGALPAMIKLRIVDTFVGDAGASALAAAVGRGALPRLSSLHLGTSCIGDVGLKALAPALRQLPKLTELGLRGNVLLGDESFAAFVALLAPQEGEQKQLRLECLDLRRTNITAAGCATLITSVTNGTLPALKKIMTTHACPSQWIINRTGEEEKNENGEGEGEEDTDNF